MDPVSELPQAVDCRASQANMPPLKIIARAKLDLHLVMATYRSHGDGRRPVLRLYLLQSCR